MHTISAVSQARSNTYTSHSLRRVIDSKSPVTTSTNLSEGLNGGAWLYGLAALGGLNVGPRRLVGALGYLVLLRCALVALARFLHVSRHLAKGSHRDRASNETNKTCVLNVLDL